MADREGITPEIARRILECCPPQTIEKIERCANVDLRAIASQKRTSDFPPLYLPKPRGSALDHSSHTPGRWGSYRLRFRRRKRRQPLHRYFR
jgi:hypothetical protein